MKPMTLAIAAALLLGGTALWFGSQRLSDAREEAHRLAQGRGGLIEAEADLSAEERLDLERQALVGEEFRRQFGDDGAQYEEFFVDSDEPEFGEPMHDPQPDRDTDMAVR